MIIGLKMSKSPIYLTGGLGFAGLLVLVGAYFGNLGLLWTGVGIGVIIILVSILTKLAKIG
jgi:hypothetical protein